MTSIHKGELMTSEAFVMSLEQNNVMLITKKTPPNHVS